MPPEYLVEYLDIDQGGVGRVAGRLSACVNSKDETTHLIVESDGAAWSIPFNRVFKIIPQEDQP